MKFPIPKDGVTAIPTNILAKQLLETLFSGDSDSTSGAIYGRGKCQVHDRRGCEFMCKECDVPLCKECVINLGKGHHVNHSLEIAPSTISMDAMEREYEEFKDKRQIFEVEMKQTVIEIKNKNSLFKHESIAMAEARAETEIAEAVKLKNESIESITADFEEAFRRLTVTQEGIESIQKRIVDRMKLMEECIDDSDPENGRKILDTLQRSLKEFASRIPRIHQCSIKYILESQDSKNDAASSDTAVKCGKFKFGTF